MPKATQFCVALDNQPGALAKLCGALKRGKVNIEAISVVESADCGWVRLVATPAAAARQALTKGRFHFCAQRVLALKLPDRPGELLAVADRLAREGINIRYVYGSTGGGPTATIILAVDDLGKADRVLGGART